MRYPLPPLLDLLFSTHSCYCLLFIYLGGGTKADIFARAHGILNLIQNGVCHRAVGKNVPAGFVLLFSPSLIKTFILEELTYEEKLLLNRR